MAQQASKVTCKQTKATADLQYHARSQQANYGTRARVYQTRTYRWICLATRWCFWDSTTPLCTKLSELQASQTPWRCTHWLFYSAGHRNGSLGFILTMLGGLDSRMKDQIYKHLTTSGQWSLPLRVYSLALLRTSIRSYNRLPSSRIVGSRAAGYIFSEDAFKFLWKGIADKTLKLFVPNSKRLGGYTQWVHERT